MSPVKGILQCSEKQYQRWSFRPLEAGKVLLKPVLVCRVQPLNQTQFVLDNIAKIANQKYTIRVVAEGSEGALTVRLHLCLCLCLVLV